MPLGSFLPPGLAGYYGTQQLQQEQAQNNLRGVLGVLGGFQRQQELDQAAQLAPLKLNLLQAQVANQNRASALDAALPNLVKGATGPDGQIDFGKLSASLLATPGGVQAGLQLHKSEEDRATNLQRAQELLAQKELAAQRDHEVKMMLAGSKADRDAENARHNRVMESLSSLRTSIAGQSGGARMEPFKFSVNGENVQGWRDRAGNVFGPDKNPVPTPVGPEITSADQRAAQERAAAQQAASVLSQNLARMDKLVTDNPRTIAGPTAPIMNTLRYLAAQPGLATRPGAEFDQLIESSLAAADKAGKLSNQQKNELRDLFKTGVLGDPESVKKGIQLFEQYTGIKRASASTPVARAQPGKVIDFHDLPGGATNGR